MDYLLLNLFIQTLESGLNKAFTSSLPLFFVPLASSLSFRI